MGIHSVGGLARVARRLRGTEPVPVTEPVHVIEPVDVTEPVHVTEPVPATEPIAVGDPSGNGAAERVAPEATTDEPVDERVSWRRAVLVGIAAFVVSRLCIIGAAGIRGSQVVVDAATHLEPSPSTARLLSGVFTQWDGLWYLRIAREGYPRVIPPDITFHQEEARAAFFPLYPAVVRWADRVLPGGDTAAALGINLVLGIAAVVLVGLLARRLADTVVAERAMVLFAIFPGSYVLTYAYAEALLIVLAAACFVLLLDRRWELAGLVAAFATATRPNGIAVVAACAVAAAIAIRDRREWRALAAPLLAPVGLIGFHVWLALHTGEATPWLRVQREAWDEGWSFGSAALSRVGDFFSNPVGSPTSFITVATLTAMGVGVWACYRHRLPPAMIAYCAVVIALMLLPSTVTARPRFLLTAFPLFICVAAWFPRRRGPGNDLIVLLSGAGLVGLTGIYAVYAAVP